MPGTGQTSQSQALTVPPRGDIGQILLRLGAVTAPQLDECLKIQHSMAGQAHVPRLGEILLQKKYTTKEAIQKALSEQNKRVLLCPRCNIMVTVSLRADAIGYKCGKCETILIEPSPDRADDSIDSIIIVNSSLPVPPEVQEARKDPGKRFGKYIILAEIGRGGIGSIYRAWDVYLNQYVALKRIKPPPQGSGRALRHTRVASLMNEAHNAIKLRHPNIVSIYDIGRIDDEYYISMEYLDGRTMIDEIQDCKKAGKVSPFHDQPRKWLGVLYETAQALHYAHTRPVPTLHCDLKPANIMVTKEGRTCVLDFGLARQLGEIKVEQGIVSGTPSYMAPEQAAGRNDLLDARTDVYGLGAILYELLAGQPPFTGEVMDVLKRVQDEKPKAPSELAWGRDPATGSSRRMLLVPPELEALCMRCLSKDSAKRPLSSLIFAEEIAHTIGGGKRSLPKMPAATSFQQEIQGIAHSLGAKKGRWVPVLLMLFMMLLAAFGTWMLQPKLAGLFGGGSRVELAMKHLEDFRPDLVHAMDLEILKQPEYQEVTRRLDQISAFKQRLMEEIEAQNPYVQRLTIGPKVEKNVTLRRANAEHVMFMVGQQDPDTAAWSRFGPAGVHEMAKACKRLLDQAGNRYGLALYALTAGANGMARDLLQTLDRTQFAAPAAEYLKQLNEPK
jgi:serine/threonine protein kinase